MWAQQASRALLLHCVVVSSLGSEGTVAFELMCHGCRRVRSLADIHYHIAAVCVSDELTHFPFGVDLVYTVLQLHNTQA